MHSLRRALPRSPLRTARTTCAQLTRSSTPLLQRTARPLATAATSPAPTPSSRSKVTTATKLTSPLNLPKWLSENAHLLQPPINNFCIYSDPLTVMVVGGPNARTDYHINETPEFFYQYKGRMLLKTVQNNGTEFKDIYINEGELFLLPANVPHNPVRFADTVGLVIEQPRPETSLDRLRWYCQNCTAQVHEASFYCTDLGSQIKDAVNHFRDDAAARKCAQCGEVCDVAPSKDAMEKMRTAPS